MGYRVEYMPIRKVRNMKIRTCRVPVLTGLFFCLFLFLVFSYWPRGAEIIQDLVIPGDPDITIAFVETFADQIQNGEPFSEALAAFCHNMKEALLVPG